MAEVIARLLRHRDQLKALGVDHAAVFGSVSRGDARDASDIDILVELLPDQRTVFDLTRIERAVARVFDSEVHVAISDQLKPHLRDSILADAAYAF